MTDDGRYSLKSFPTGGFPLEFTALCPRGIKQHGLKQTVRTRFSRGKCERTPEIGERASSRVEVHHAALPSGLLKVLFSELEKG